MGVRQAKAQAAVVLWFKSQTLRIQITALKPLQNVHVLITRSAFSSVLPCSLTSQSLLGIMVIPAQSKPERRLNKDLCQYPLSFQH